MTSLTDDSRSLPSHLPALDGIRGLAIALVLPHNLSLLTAPPNLVAKVIEAWFLRGWIGVQLFFVLSGFLITGILLDTQRAPNHFSAFFWRRVLRIFPLYYAVLIVMYVVLPLFGRGLSLQQHPHEWWQWVYLTNWVQPFHPDENSLAPMWSLAVEEQFYLLWPFLLYRRDARQVMRLSLFVAVAALAVRLVLLLVDWPGKNMWPGEAVYELTPCRMDALALGAAGAAALRVESIRQWLCGRVNTVLAAAIGVLLAGAAMSHGYDKYGLIAQSAGYSLLALAFALFVVAAACADAVGMPGWPTLLRAAPLRHLGRYSYAMYVLHGPLQIVIGLPLLAAMGLERNDQLGLALAYIAIGCVATYAVSALSYRYLEQPFLRLKRHFVAVPAPSLQSV